MSIVRRRAGGSVRRPIVVALLVHLETHAYQRPPLSQRPRAPAPRAWADDVVAEFAGGARDGRGDVARASRVREALEALKAPLAPAWDNDECVALRVGRAHHAREPRDDDACGDSTTQREKSTAGRVDRDRRSSARGQA